jgi:hypothetical protein
VIRRLRAQGHLVRAFGAQDAADLAVATDELIAVPPVLPGAGGVLTAINRLSTSRRALAGVDMVISDGDMPSVVAARVLGLPTLAVGHELVFSRCVLPRSLPAPTMRRQILHAWHTSLRWCDGVAVHFAHIAAGDPRTRAARPSVGSPPAVDPRFADATVLYFRDDNSQPVATALLAAGHRVVQFGARGEVAPGVEVQPFDQQLFRSALACCRAVVASAGSNVLSECAWLGTRVLACHRAGDAEQELNAYLVEAERLGVRWCINEPDALAAAIRRLDGLPLTETGVSDRWTNALPPVDDVVCGWVNAGGRWT